VKTEFGQPTGPQLHGTATLYTFGSSNSVSTVQTSPTKLAVQVREIVATPCFQYALHYPLSLSATTQTKKLTTFSFTFLKSIVEAVSLTAVSYCGN